MRQELTRGQGLVLGVGAKPGEEDIYADGWSGSGARGQCLCTGRPVVSEPKLGDEDTLEEEGLAWGTGA